MTAVEVVEYNAGNAPLARVAADLLRLARRYLVTALCEVADRAKEMNATGAQVLTQASQDRGHVALLISAPAKVLSWGYVRCTRRSFVGAWGAGPKVIAAKWILWALVDFADGGEPVTMAVTHAVPSVQRKAHGPIARVGLARRRRLYRKHMAAAAAWAETVAGPLDLCGDFNATGDFDLLQPLRDAGLTCSSTPSRGARDIDHHWTRGLVVEAVTAL